MPEWIPMTEARPDAHTRVFVLWTDLDGERNAGVGEYFLTDVDEAIWTLEGDYYPSDEMVTHWMSIPPVPDEQP